MKINVRIKELREKLDMTQEQLAEKTGYKTRSAINKIESGSRDINQSQIASFAKALNVTPAYLMGWENDSDMEDITTIAAHHEGDWSEEEIDEIEKFKEFVRSKRK